MKNISHYKPQYLQYCCKKYCGIDSPEACQKQPCECNILAEIQSLCRVVIPSGFDKFYIDDFDGQVSNEQVLSSSDAIKAKDDVCLFCWGKEYSKVRDLSVVERSNVSKMSKRIRAGDNIVIHGASRPSITNYDFSKDEDNTTGDISHKTQVGRTMIASILTKEAIWARAKPSSADLIYEWIDYSSLIQYLKRDDATDYQFSDWLVIDNITRMNFQKSKGQLAFEQTLLDPFLFFRMSHNLTTVLVFQFDIAVEGNNMEEKFGVAIDKFIRRKNTATIFLPGDRGKQWQK